MSLLDYHPIIGPIREMTGNEDDPESMNTEGACSAKLPCGLYDNGLGGDTMCDTCGYSEVSVGESCPLCGDSYGGTGIDKYSAMPGQGGGSSV